MQPLDRSFFKTLKCNYNRAADNWMTSNAAKRITVFDVAELFCMGYDNSAAIEIARKGFETTGIWPYDDQKFTDEDFAAAEVTDEPLTTAAQSKLASAEVVDLQTSDCPVPFTSATADPVPSAAVRQTSDCPVPSTSADPVPSAAPRQTSDCPVPSTSADPVPSAAVRQTSDCLVPSTSASADLVPSAAVGQTSPAQCEPHPGLEEAKRILNELSPKPKLQSSRPRTRKAESAVVLTSSPFKALLQEKASKPTTGSGRPTKRWKSGVKDNDTKAPHEKTARPATCCKKMLNVDAYLHKDLSSSDDDGNVYDARPVETSGSGKMSWNKSQSSTQKNAD
jgi:hypothetical protein